MAPRPPGASPRGTTALVEEEHGAGTQAVNAFLGVAGEDGELEGAAIGLDYEYRLSADWGVGPFAETVTGIDRSFTAGAQLYWHALGELVFVAGPGIERHRDEWRPIGRLGAFYELPLGDGWVMSPGVFYDVTEAEGILILGLDLGYVW